MNNSNIKFTQENTVRGLHIPTSALRISGINAERAVEYHTLPETVVVLKKQMTAVELANAIDSLQEVVSDLFDALCRACGGCEGCSEECPYDATDYEMAIELPEELLKKAGIAPNEKLFAAAAEGGVMICSAERVPSLQSIPGNLMDQLLGNGICPGELDEHVIKGDIVYGG